MLGIIKNGTCKSRDSMIPLWKDGALRHDPEKGTAILCGETAKHHCEHRERHIAFAVTVLALLSFIGLRDVSSEAYTKAGLRFDGYAHVYTSGK